MYTIDLCHICLRDDKILKIVNYKLSDFHDELCEYSNFCLMERQYCIQCEYLLLKMYKFKEKCCMANNILRKWKKSKVNAKEQLSTLLPPSTIGIWEESRSWIYNYSHEDESHAISTNNGGITHTTSNCNIKLEPDPTENKPVGDILLDEETEIFTSNYVTHNDVIKLCDPLNNKEIRIQYDKDCLKENMATVDVESISEKHIKTKLSSNLDKDINMHDLSNLGQIKAVGVLDNSEKINTSDILHITESSSDVDKILDDLSLNSDDDCDSDDFTLNDKLYCRRKTAKAKINIPKKKTQKTLNKNNVLKDDKVLSQTLMKKSLLELTGIPILDSELVGDEKITQNVRQIGKTNKATGNDNQREVTKKSSTRLKMKGIKKEAKQKVFSKESLKAALVKKFKSCGELKSEDGTVINKGCILHIITEEEPSKDFSELWDELNEKPILTTQAVSLLSAIQNIGDKYSTVFQFQYLDTEQQMLEEFNKRPSYDAYMNADFKCDLCHQWFKNKKSLENHIKCHDVTAGDLVCTICKTRTRTKELLSRHISTHKTVYKCKLCPLVTNYRMSMMNHYRQHQGVEYKCETCNLTYKSKSSYSSHLTTACKQQRSFVCTHCARTFMKKQGLTRHIYLKHREDPAVHESAGVTCTQCELTFVSRLVYAKHLLVTHNQQVTYHRILRKMKIPLRIARKIPVFICRVCNAKGKCHTWLKLHFEMEHPTVDMASLYPDNINTHLCDVCGKAYKTLYLLRDHKYLHTGERPFSCDQCPARFGPAYKLRIHKLSHAPPTLPCKLCGKMFRSKANLYTHMRTHIGDRRFKCSICDKGFLHRSSLKEHVDGVHSKIRRVEKRSIKSVARGRRSKKEQSDSD